MLFEHIDSEILACLCSDSLITLIDLPTEVFFSILCLLDGRSLCSVAQCSRYCRNIVASQEVWQELYKRDFHASTAQSESDFERFGATPRSLYRRLAGCQHIQRKPVLSTASCSSSAALQATYFDPSQSQSHGTDLSALAVDILPSTDFTLAFFLFLKQDSVGVWRPLAVFTDDKTSQVRNPALYIHPEDCRLCILSQLQPPASSTLQKFLRSRSNPVNNLSQPSLDEVEPLEWSHVALVVRGSEVSLFINGIPNNTLQVDAPVVDSSKSRKRTNRLVLGGPSSSAASGSDVASTLLQALFYDVRLYDSALSEDEIAILLRRFPPDPQEANLAERRKGLRDEERTVVHRQFGCDGCNELPIRGVRYQCVDCSLSYDLCKECFLSGRFFHGRYGPHAQDHRLRKWRKSAKSARSSESIPPP
mmetsp:Transcript_23451/g.38551  ORF Transcript_23451/g.38551 Transcript_23451/m.38551 type:complete len:420 (+) Transcript_23451:139-1398(+)